MIYLFPVRQSKRPDDVSVSQLYVIAIWDAWNSIKFFVCTLDSSVTDSVTEENPTQPLESMKLMGVHFATAQDRTGQWVDTGLII